MPSASSVDIVNNCNNMFTAAMLLVRNIIVVKVLVRRNTFDIGSRSKGFSQIADVKPKGGMYPTYLGGTRNNNNNDSIK